MSVICHHIWLIAVWVSSSWSEILFPWDVEGLCYVLSVLLMRSQVLFWVIILYVTWFSPLNAFQMISFSLWTFFFIVGISVKYFKLHLSWLPLICNLKFLFQPKRFPSFDDHFPLSLLELFSKWALGLWSCLPRVTFSFLFHVSVLSSKCWETSSILSSRILSPVMSSLLFSPLDDSFIHCMFNFQDLVVLCVLFVFLSGMFLLFV